MSGKGFIRGGVMHWLKLLLAGMLLALMPAMAQARPAMPALVFDLNSGEVLLAHDAGQPWYPASLTKLMTAWLVLEAVSAGRLSFDDEVVISRRVVNGVERGAAKYGVKPGQRMTIGTMLTFLMVRSDADMALALAEAVAGDVPRFVRMMNAAARRLNMTATHFTNPHGMHDDAQKTTARDMALLARAIYMRHLRRHADWWRFFSLRKVKKTVVRKGKPRTVELKNRNHLLFMMPEANGMKTGFLCSSGFNLLATARRDGMQLGVVVFGRRSAYNRAAVARVLLEEGFRRRRAGQGLRIPVSRLANVATHAPNMTHSICRTRILPRVDAQELAGWGVVLGPFANVLRAVAITEAELLAAELMDEARLAYGVSPVSVKVLQQAGLLARWREKNRGKRLRRRGVAAGFVWRLGEGQAVELCRRARAHGVSCAVLAPRELAALGALLPRPKTRAGKGKGAMAGAPRPRKRPARVNFSSRAATLRAGKAAATP